MGTKHFAIILSICGLYLFLRLNFLETIEFGYDQPRLASTVVDFLKNGTFLNSQKFSVASPWGNFSWGPALVLFFAPFLAISKDPVIASLLISIFNLLSIIVVIYTGYKFFSPKTGIWAGLLFATHPWWIIFSRMIYQPTPIPTFIALSVLFLFKTLKNPKSLWVSLLIFSWAVLIQAYLITFSFIATSAVVILFSLRKKTSSIKFFLPGIVSSLLIFYPSIIYYANNREMLFKFLETGGKYQTLFAEVVNNFINVISGGGFSWQLGYAYKEFISQLYFPEITFFAVTAIILFLILFSVVSAIKERNFPIICLTLFLIAPLWALYFVGVEYVVPRYFLYVLAPLCLILGYSIDKLINRFGKIFLFLPMVLTGWWIYLILNYFSFVKNYPYPNGFLSLASDVPYSFLNESFKWIKNDATKEGFSGFTVSSDPEYPHELRLNWAQRYYWDNVLGKTDLKGNGETGYYLMIFSPGNIEGNKIVKQFGPYVIYQIKK